MAMADLSALSGALSGWVAAAAPRLVGLEADPSRVLPRGLQRSGFMWTPGIVVGSEQGLPDGPLRAVLPGGAAVEAVPAGRDPGSNVAVFRVPPLQAEGWPDPVPGAGTLAVGTVVVLLGADGRGGPAARLGLVNALGAAWTSMAGGRIDRLITLDATLPPQEEGGPVLDAAGGLLGMSTLGPRRRPLVIPTATVARVVQTLLSVGRMARGWLGAGLHPVAVPAALALAGAAAGLMVMSLAAGGPAEAAGLLPGDIILAMDGAAMEQPRAAAAALAALPPGQTVSLQLLRGGVMQIVTAVIGERPAC
jgi:S1-C subfamily serine protease